MFDYESILKENPNGVMATQDGSSVKTRVFQFLFSDKNKVYFCTANDKPVFEQLQSNPHVSFCTYPENYSPVVSINGTVTFVDDISLKTRALDENPGIKAIYETATNPIFELFYITVEEVQTFSFDDGAQTFTL
jgi:uncharacterized pyridoxamine 5'-phosphate oxidase family protein